MEWVDKTCRTCKYCIDSHCRYMIQMVWNNMEFGNYPTVKIRDDYQLACSKWRER